MSDNWELASKQVLHGLEPVQVVKLVLADVHKMIKIQTSDSIRPNQYAMRIDMELRWRMQEIERMTE